MIYTKQGYWAIETKHQNVVVADAPKCSDSLERRQCWWSDDQAATWRQETPTKGR